MPSRPPFPLSDARPMRLVFESPGITRRELAQLLGLSSASLTALVKRLATANVIQELGTTRGKTGRRAGALVVSPEIALATCHSVSAGQVRSAVVNAWGELKSNRTVSWRTHEQLVTAIDAFVPHGRSYNSTLAVLSVPTIPFAGAESLEVPVLLGRTRLPLPKGTKVCSSAASLAAYALRQDASSWNKRTLCVDLCDGATAVLINRRDSENEIDLLPLKPFAPLLTVDSFEEFAAAFELGETSVVESIAEAERDGDPEAATYCDALLEQASDLLATLAEMFKPDQMLVGLADHVEQLIDLEDLRKKSRRKCSKATNEMLSLRLLETTPWTRVAGAGLAAIRSWLTQFAE